MSDDESVGGDLFQEPEGYFKPEEEPTFVKHQMLNGNELHLRLVGHNPLWGHLLWNAGRTLADYLETNCDQLIQGKTVLELGAGAGLPSLICAVKGATQTVVTDYPDPDLVENLRYNVEHCNQLPSPRNIEAEGYLWGAPATEIERHLPTSDQTQGFDLLILADLLFNHSEHRKLVSTVQQTLKKSPDAQALVFFTPYRPWLLEKDLGFFDLAQSEGFNVEKIFEKTMEKVMFEEDPGVSILPSLLYSKRADNGRMSCCAELSSGTA
ncbi:hypothetical protein D0859_04742 [Hortaea werneckii]|uniref:Protein N-terminal and lysine N-methyltransferase EFM7 n=1 Tax=Hortaea werneckii TaxID=91943 RepID=A0A3M7J0D3_HORWE|nr:hypothetical protein D0859_04742 [Hortaea werneckii]